MQKKKIDLFGVMLAGALFAPTWIFTATPASAQVRFGNVGSEPVGSVVGNASERRNTTERFGSFDSGIQSRVNGVSAGLTVASVSGTQTVLGQTVSNVDPTTMQIAFDLINAPKDSNPSALAAFTQSLGGSSSAQNLAASMVGMRKGDGSIDATVLTNSVNAYNTYIQTLATDPRASARTAGDVDSYVQSLPPGQRVAQVLLGKLLEASRG
jgi:hypothetical protein